MVALIDRLADGLSSVYAFFEPEIRGASFGTYNVLWQIQRCASLGCRTFTLGIGSPKVERWPTRRRFRPVEGLARRGVGTAVGGRFNERYWLGRCLRSQARHLSKSAVDNGAHSCCPSRWKPVSPNP
jgi:hypothetical protein